MCQHYIGCTEFPVLFREILLGARDQNPDVTQYSTGRTSKNHEDVGIKLKKSRYKNVHVRVDSVYCESVVLQITGHETSEKKKSGSVW